MGVEAPQPPRALLSYRKLNYSRSVTSLRSVFEPLLGDMHEHKAPAGLEGAVILGVDNLYRSFGAREVVRNLTFHLQPGERLALCGPNGSGKTTVLRCIAATIAPTSGSICVCGYPVGSIAARAAVGISLSQERSFYLRLSGRANLAFFARLRGLSRHKAEQRINALGEELEIDAILAERADRCSTGMIQQLSLARALLSEPPLLLLDEPTRSLDHDARKRMWAALERRTQTAVLIATHDSEDVGHCDGQIDLGAPAAQRR
jgi:ABC-2 type transport system ATP-binding protein